jgi:hypothetical protein
MSTDINSPWSRLPNFSDFLDRTSSPEKGDIAIGPDGNPVSESISELARRRLLEPQKGFSIIELNGNECAARIAEAIGERKRPAGQSATDALAAMSPETRAAAIRAAKAVLDYVENAAAKAQGFRL